MRSVFLFFTLIFMCLPSAAQDNAVAVMPLAPSGTVSGTNGRPTFVIAPHPAQFVRVVVVSHEHGTTALDSWFLVQECDPNCALLPAESVPVLYNGGYTLYMQGYMGGQGYTAWSEGLTFTLQDAPPHINSLTLVGIQQGDNPCPTAAGVLTCMTPTPVVSFSFEPAAGDWIELRIVQTASGETAYQEWVHVTSDSRCNAVQCAVQVNVPLDDSTRYTVYLRSYGAGGYSTGGIGGYTRPGSETEGDPHRLAHFRIALAEVSLQNLSHEIVDGDIRLSWDHLPQAAWYEVHIAESTGQMVHHQWYDSAASCHIRCSLYPDAAFMNGTYTWAVRYWNHSLSTWFNASDSVALSLPPPGHVTPDSSANGIFRWQNVDHAAWYHLLIESSGGETVYTEWYRAGAYCTTLCIVQPKAQLTPGAYHWRVDAWGSGGFSPQGEPAALSIPQPGLLVLIHPENHTAVVSAPLRFEWQPGSTVGASDYQLQLLDANLALLEQFEINAVCGQSCVFLLTDPPPNGHYRWRVRAADVAEGQWSQVAPFVIRIPPAASPKLLAPAPDTIQPATPDFAWTPVNHAIWYRLVIHDVNSRIIWDSWYAAAAVCSNLDCHVSLNGVTLEAGKHQWMVFSWGQGGGNPSLQWAFIQL